MIEAPAVLQVPKTRHFEPEFLGQPPRAIPDELRLGPHARNRRRTRLALVAAGAGCLLAARVPGVDTLAIYLLPLAWLSWIGGALVAIAAVDLLDSALRAGRFRYVRDGVPLPARVVDIVMAPSVIVNGQVNQYAFTATMALEHPETHVVTLVHAKSRDFEASRRASYETPFRVGDEVTAVYLPGRFEKTVRLYAFLDLSPTLALVRRAPERSSPWALVGLLAAVPAIFVVLFANVYAHGRYLPLAFDYRRALVPMVLGGVLIGGGVLFGLVASHRRDQRRTAERNRQAAASGRALEPARPFMGAGVQGWALRVAVAAGSILLGAVTALCWSLMLNAWADRSPATAVPARVLARTMTTHALVVRQYELEYELVVPASGEKRSMLTTPAHLARFGTDCAVASVRAGRLGWPWVETVEPADGNGCRPLE